MKRYYDVGLALSSLVISVAMTVFCLIGLWEARTEDDVRGFFTEGGFMIVVFILAVVGSVRYLEDCLVERYGTGMVDIMRTIRSHWVYGPRRDTPKIYDWSKED